MCSWNDNTSIGGKQTILELPKNLCEWKENRSVCIDSCIVDQIKALWDSNIETLGCCCGHGKPELGGITLIIASGYGQEDIERIADILRKHDNRNWNILQWRLQTVTETEGDDK